MAADERYLSHATAGAGGSVGGGGGNSWSGASSGQNTVPTFRGDQ